MLIFLILASNNTELIIYTEEALSERFDMTDIGNVKYSLGMEVVQSHFLADYVLRIRKLASSFFLTFKALRRMELITKRQTMTNCTTTPMQNGPQIRNNIESQAGMLSY